jgi:hypothetical protein
MRKLASVLAALACAAGLSVATIPAAQAAVIPVHGAYDGVDHHQRQVSFSFNGTTINHFRVGSLTIGTAHVSNGMWHETCGGGYCFKGQWITDTHVQGFWRHGGSHEWTSWSASTMQIRPYVGSYMGSDHTGLRIHFTYSNGSLRAFTWDHNHIGDARVAPDGSFNVCHPTFCFKGHWQSDYYVVGEWRHASQSTWHTWDANAYSP